MRQREFQAETWSGSEWGDTPVRARIALQRTPVPFVPAPRAPAERRSVRRSHRRPLFLARLVGLAASAGIASLVLLLLDQPSMLVVVLGWFTVESWALTSIRGPEALLDVRPVGHRTTRLLALLAVLLVLPDVRGRAPLAMLLIVALGVGEVATIGTLRSRRIRRRLRVDHPRTVLVVGRHDGVEVLIEDLLAAGCHVVAACLADWDGQANQVGRVPVWGGLGQVAGIADSFSVDDVVVDI
ncbi:MAG: nucleoside-diphosphate sugar epimerase/dehydratase, partial [Nocardioidaceae bacterium]